MREMGFGFQNHFSYLVVVFLIFSCLYLSTLASSNCNLYEGTWVNGTAPYYDANSCPFIKPDFNCQKNGRPDKLYLSYKWKPTACELPKFNGQDFLTRFKGKKIIFVGDSLIENQWMSMTCMLHTAVPQAKYNLAKNGSIFNFSFPDHGVSVVYDHNVFLVDLVNRVLKIDSLKSGDLWKDADALIFNTWHWWDHTGNLRAFDKFEEGGKAFKDMDRLVAYEKGLTTWSKWIDTNINRQKTRVFFLGISPVHFIGSEWNETQASCKGQTQPISGSTYPAGLPPPMAVVKKVLSKMSKPVELLDITTLSQLRKDGHQSIYGKNGRGATDCSHWCLGGVPDTWNHLLYASIVLNSAGKK